MKAHLECMKAEERIAMNLDEELIQIIAMMITSVWIVLLLAGMDCLYNPTH